MKSAPEPRVLVVLSASAAWSRGVLRGFTEVARGRPFRLLHYHPVRELEWLVRVWKPAAVVLQASLYPELFGASRSYAVVSVNDDASARGIPSVCLDEGAIGELAAEHLLSKGLRDVTTFRFTDDAFAIARERAFQRAVAARSGRLVPGWWADEKPSAAEDPAAMSDWVRSLPKPCGVFACADSWARVVARYAEVAGVKIPEELALLGVDNDTVECELAAPPLSSIAIPWRTMGAQAAELVAAALSSRGEVSQRVVIPPLDVVPRRSTDVRAIEDPLVARAVAWIAEHCTSRVTLGAVARAASCSRQRLEQRFRAAVGRTVMQEVRRARVDEAKRLLSSTTLPLKVVAEECGFTDAAALSVAFQRAAGVPPGAYRRRFRGLDPTEE